MTTGYPELARNYRGHFRLQTIQRALTKPPVRMPSRVDFELDSRSIQAQLVEHQFPGKKSSEIESRIGALYVKKLISKITFRIADRDTGQIEARKGE